MVPLGAVRRATSPTFDQSEAEKLSYTHTQIHTQTENRHTVRPCSTSSACKNFMAKITVVALMAIMASMAIMTIMAVMVLIAAIAFLAI